MSEETKAKAVSVEISESAVKAAVREFLDKNPRLVWGQRTCAFALAYVINQSAVPVDDFKALAKFLAQESLHGLAGNASQFKQWFYGKEAGKKASLDIDDLAE